MGIITPVSTTEIDWSSVQLGEPPAGRYTWRGRNSSGSDVYQHNDQPTVVCVRLFGSLMLVDVAELQHVGSVSTGGGANYGLTQSPDTVYSYNVASRAVSAVRENGRAISSSSPSTSSRIPQQSFVQTFNVPTFVTGSDGLNYYPREYWYQTGNVYYFSLNPPQGVIDSVLNSDRNLYPKVQSVRLTSMDVRTYSQQTRTPDQSAVMGVAINRFGTLAARDHLTAVFGLVQEPRSWHWCHLVAHSMRANVLGQVADNLVAGTAGVNGAMLALENAVKEVLAANDGPPFLDYEATAHVFEDTHIAKFIRVIVGDFDSWTCTFRFEATIAERELTAQTREFIRMIVEARQEVLERASSSAPSFGGNNNNIGKPGGGSPGFGGQSIGF